MELLQRAKNEQGELIINQDNEDQTEIIITQEERSCQSYPWMKISIVIALLLSIGSSVASVYALTTNGNDKQTTITTIVTNNTITHNIVGDYKLSAQTKSHDQWLLCDGSYVNKTDYPQLYLLIGDTFGAEHDNIFALPNATDKTIGIAGNKYSFGSVVGSDIFDLQLTTDNIPAHHHFIANSESGTSTTSQYLSYTHVDGATNYYYLVGTPSIPTRFQSSDVGNGDVAKINVMQPTAFISNLFIYAK